MQSPYDPELRAEIRQLRLKSLAVLELSAEGQLIRAG
jgi:hypothetical protein